MAAERLHSVAALSVPYVDQKAVLEPTVPVKFATERLRAGNQHRILQPVL